MKVALSDEGVRESTNAIKGEVDAPESVNYWEPVQSADGKQTLHTELVLRGEETQMISSKIRKHISYCTEMRR